MILVRKGKCLVELHPGERVEFERDGDVVVWEVFNVYPFRVRERIKGYSATVEPAVTPREFVEMKEEKEKQNE